MEIPRYLNPAAIKKSAKRVITACAVVAIGAGCDVNKPSPMDTAFPTPTDKDSLSINQVCDGKHIRIVINGNISTSGPGGVYTRIIGDEGPSLIVAVDGLPFAFHEVAINNPFNPIRPGPETSLVPGSTYRAEVVQNIAVPDPITTQVFPDQIEWAKGAIVEGPVVASQAFTVNSCSQ